MSRPSDKWRASYNYTLMDLATSLGCPQCRALDLLRAVADQDVEDAMGQRVACREIMREPHRCGRPTRMVYLAGGLVREAMPEPAAAAPGPLDFFAGWPECPWCEGAGRVAHDHCGGLGCDRDHCAGGHVTCGHCRGSGHRNDAGDNYEYDW